MPASILLEVTHPARAPGRIDGFRFLWAFYVTGYRPDRHCQPGLRGRRVPEFCTTTAESGRVVVLDRVDRMPYVYVCGVAAVPKPERGARNLHLPLRFAEGETVEATTYNGYVFRARNAVLLPIPEPEFRDGRSEEHARCKNYRFAAHHFGPSAARA